MPVPMRLVDVAAQARKMFGADGAVVLRPDLPEHDWRFEASLPRGATVTFSRYCTAAEVANYLTRDGVEIPTVDPFAELRDEDDR
jgi:hypothetical protein